MNRRLPITRGRLVVLLVGTPLALLFIAVLALTVVSRAGQGSYHVRLDLPVRGNSVEISLDSGDLNVRQATAAQLKLSGIAMYSLVRSGVTALIDRSGVTVRSRCHFVSLTCSFNYRVGVPAGKTETFSDGQGDITVWGIANEIVTASDRAGSITLTFTSVPDRVVVTDALGEVKIVLPPGLTVYNVSAHGRLGKTSIGVPTSPLSKHLISVNNSSGNIVITS